MNGNRTNIPANTITKLLHLQYFGGKEVLAIISVSTVPLKSIIAKTFVTLLFIGCYLTLTKSVKKSNKGTESMNYKWKNIL